MEYCTDDDVALVTDINPGGTTMQWAKRAASLIVDSYTGATFSSATAKTVTVADVRSPVVLLDEPFADVSQVLLDEFELDATSYTVMPWGLVLKQPPISSHLGYGSEVTVSASFGYEDVPEPVRLATALVVAELLRSRNTSAVPLPDEEGNTVLPEVGAVRAQLESAVEKDVLSSTGVVEADRLLAPYRTIVIA